MQTQGSQAQERVVRTYRVEKQELPVESLLEMPRFCLCCGAFCCLRLLHPILFGLCFPDGPHQEDVAAQIGTTCAWLAAVCGLVATSMLYEPWRSWLARQTSGGSRGHGHAAGWLQLWALRALAAALLLELVHQLFALARWQFFWGTGVLGDEDGWRAPLALALVTLHAGGLLGTAMLVAAYGRCYRAAWRRLGERRVAAAELGGGGRQAASAAPPAAGTPVRPPPAKHDAHAGPPSSGAAWQAAAARQPPPAAAPPRGSGREASREERPAEGRSGREGERPPSSTSPRAWFWANDQWVRVRVLRSVGDGTAAVRLPGGAVVQTRQSLLVRSSGEDQPPPAPEEQAKSGGPRSAEERPPPKAPSSAPEEPMKSGGPKSGEERPPPKAEVAEERPLPKADAHRGSAPEEAADEGERWAERRLAQLRKELQALDRMGPAERRGRLRALQRELHPDKQPPELRDHARPLFQLVQREWEVDAAAQREASKAAAAEPA